MAKIVLLAIMVWLILVIIKRYAASMKNHTLHSPEKSEDMVQCAKCGVHLPKNDSLLIDNKYYCCKAHANSTDDHGNPR